MFKSILAILAYSLLFLSAPATSAEKAVFAGGCFWCMEADFQDMDGVLDAVSGFMGINIPINNGSVAKYLDAMQKLGARKWYPQHANS